MITASHSNPALEIISTPPAPANPNQLRKFPHPYPFRMPSPEQRKRNGIRVSEHVIGYYTEEIAVLTASGPSKGRGLEKDRLDSLKLFSNTIAFHQHSVASHRKVLASLPAEE